MAVVSRILADELVQVPTQAVAVAGADGLRELGRRLFFDPAQGCVTESNEAGRRVRGGRRHGEAMTSRPCQGSAGGHRPAQA